MGRNDAIGTEEQNHELELDIRSAHDLQNQNAALRGAHSEERDLVNQLLGQAQMADAFAKFSVTVTTSKLAFVKENKLYKALAGKQTGNGYQLSGTWEEFCGLLGMSREKADLDINNLRAFGEDALESMSRMGIGYREMRQFRKLPEDQKTALIEVAKGGDKEAFVDLAEEIIAKHAREKEQLTKERDEALADYDAQGERLAKVTAARDEALLENEKMRRRIQTAPADEVAKQLRTEAAGIAVEFQSLLQTKFRPAIKTLLEHAETSGIDHRSYLADALRQLEVDIAVLREDYDLDVTPMGEPDWMKPEALAEAEDVVASLRANQGLQS